MCLVSFAPSSLSECLYDAYDERRTIPVTKWEYTCYYLIVIALCSLCEVPVL